MEIVTQRNCQWFHQKKRKRKKENCQWLVLMYLTIFEKTKKWLDAKSVELFGGLSGRMRSSQRITKKTKPSGENRFCAVQCVNPTNTTVEGKTKRKKKLSGQHVPFNTCNLLLQGKSISYYYFSFFNLLCLGPYILTHSTLSVTAQ